MQKSVLFSIHPEFCELIVSLKKPIEIRKTAPKLPTPFKGLIYCTKPKKILKYVFRPEDYPEEMRPDKNIFCKVADGRFPFCSEVNGNGKIIGEFICDGITKFYCLKRYAPELRCFTTLIQTTKNEIIDIEAGACLDANEIDNYLDGKDGYALHISNLKLYDRPRELSEFTTEEPVLQADIGRDACTFCDCFSCNDPDCSEKRCHAAYDRYLDAFRAEYSLNRPPQSWRYCYDLEDMK